MNRATVFSRHVVVLVAALATGMGINGCSGKEAPTEEVIRPVRTRVIYAAGGERIR